MRQLFPRTVDWFRSKMMCNRFSMAAIRERLTSSESISQNRVSSSYTLTISLRLCSSPLEIGGFAAFQQAGFCFLLDSEFCACTAKSKSTTLKEAASFYILSYGLLHPLSAEYSSEQLFPSYFILSKSGSDEGDYDHEKRDTIRLPMRWKSGNCRLHHNHNLIVADQKPRRKSEIAGLNAMISPNIFWPETFDGHHGMDAGGKPSPRPQVGIKTQSCMIDPQRRRNSGPRCTAAC